MKYLNYIVALVLVSLTFPSCNNKDLCYSHPHGRSLKVEFDWRDAPEADPEGMCVFFYPTTKYDINGERIPMRRFDFRGSEGGKIDIQLGRYYVLCYNNDTEAVQIKDHESMDAHIGFTRNGQLFESLFGSGASYYPRVKGTEDERVVICPDMLWGCNSYLVDISNEGVQVLEGYTGSKGDDTPPVADDDESITLYPHEMVCHYDYEIRNVENIASVTQMCAAVTGMAPSIYMNSETLHPEPVTLPVNAAFSDKTTISGQFLTFGHHEAVQDPHYLVLYVWFFDGSKYYYTFDITKQVHDAPDRKNVHIVIDGLSLPQIISGGGGLDAEVDDWIVVDQKIMM